MAISLLTMVNRLRLDVHARNEVPSESQYAMAVTDAVLDYSQRCPITKSGTLTLVANQAAYDLPADFLSLIDVENPNIYDGGSGLMNTPFGLVPTAIGGGIQTTRVEGGQIIFDPAPTYAMTRKFRYRAIYAMVSETYPSLGDVDAQIIGLKARASALSLQATAEAGDAISFSIGDESVDKRGGVAALQDATRQALAAYETAVTRRVGVVALRSEYLPWETNGW